jgi:hypothetical protein
VAKRSIIERLFGSRSSSEPEISKTPDEPVQEPAAAEAEPKDTSVEPLDLVDSLGDIMHMMSKIDGLDTELRRIERNKADELGRYNIIIDVEKAEDERSLVKANVPLTKVESTLIKERYAKYIKYALTPADAVYINSVPVELERLDFYSHGTPVSAHLYNGNWKETAGSLVINLKDKDICLKIDGETIFDYVSDQETINQEACDKIASNVAYPLRKEMKSIISEKDEAILKAKRELDSIRNKTHEAVVEKLQEIENNLSRSREEAFEASINLINEASNNHLTSKSDNAENKKRVTQMGIDSVILDAMAAIENLKKLYRNTPPAALSDPKALATLDPESETISLPTGTLRFRDDLSKEDLDRPYQEYLRGVYLSGGAHRKGALFGSGLVFTDSTGDFRLETTEVSFQNSHRRFDDICVKYRGVAIAGGMVYGQRDPNDDSKWIKKINLHNNLASKPKFKVDATNGKEVSRYNEALATACESIVVPMTDSLKSSHIDMLSTIKNSEYTARQEKEREERIAKKLQEKQELDAKVTENSKKVDYLLEKFGFGGPDPLNPSTDSAPTPR